MAEDDSVPASPEPRFARRLTRLPSYDYSQEGAYFVTVCTLNRVSLFGDVTNDAMQPNECGQAVLDVWNRLPHHYPHVQTLAFVLMPNHVHGILLIQDVGEEASHRNQRRERRGLPDVVGTFKSYSARSVNRIRDTPGQSVWQRGFYDHVIRNESSLARVTEYITNNPVQWNLDHDNPETRGRV
ncbi:MAG: transposase [Dehalococcoidia bacterium]|jgi:REP element-mobilizing transposase RayT|nr:transposase [Dehalococcoidia bacterium]